jgi:short-subunit dehydrogenase
MTRRFSIQDCTALVTGATAGLGAEFARQLAPRARYLILVGRRRERLASLEESLRKDFPKLSIESVPADLALPEERQRLATHVVRSEIPLNLLINNAGLGDLGPFDTAEWGRLAPMLAVNIGALTHLTHLLLPMLRACNPSAVLNVSSIAGFFPLPEMAVYSATKAYVTGFSEALRMELMPHGVAVTALCPGPVPTEFFEVASREGKPIRAMDRSHPAFAATPELVVREALAGIERNRPGVIPNALLAAVVRTVRLLPFPVIREAIRLGAGPKTSAQD